MFFFFCYLVAKDKYLHHNNRSYNNNFLFYKEFDNLFINVKIKLIFSNSFSDINWGVLFVLYLFYNDSQREISGFLFIGIHFGNFIKDIILSNLSKKVV